MQFLNNLLTIFTIVTGSLSLVGSTLLICTILRSKKKLSVPYRRLIFGTSCYDVFQSLGLTTSIFLSPAGTADWSVGNTATCDVQGFFTTIGAIGVPIYLCSLCIYYFCIIRLNMKKSAFKKIEPCLHAAPITYSSFCGIFALANQYFNNAGSVCYVAPKPVTCEIFPDQECERGAGASRFRLLFLTYPSMVIFVIVCIIMTTITLYAKRMEKHRSRYSFPRALNQDQPSKTDALWGKMRNTFWCLRSSSKPSLPNRCESSGNISETANEISSSSHLSPQTKRTSQKRNDRMGEINKQALLYIGSYILSYGFVWAQSLHSLATKSPPLIWLRVLSSIFFPLQGFVNIFIYCRPHIVSLRSNFPDEYTWFQAFIVVLKSGGDDPLPSQRRKSSAHKRLQQSSPACNRRFSASLMEMDSDSSTNGSVAVMSEKKSSFATIPVDIENQTGDANNENLSAVDEIPVELKNIIHDTEQILNSSLEEFRTLAGEDDTAPKTESEDNDKLDDTDFIADTADSRTMSSDSSR